MYRLRILTQHILPVLVFQLGFPLSLISNLFRAADRDPTRWTADSCLAAAFVGFVTLVGAWSWFGRWVRLALPATLLVAVVPAFPLRGGGFIVGQGGANRVGNSGNTTEPHLHVHAEAGPYPGRFSGRPGVAIRFDGRFLVRNDRVFPGASRHPSHAGA